MRLRIGLSIYLEAYERSHILDASYQLLELIPVSRRTASPGPTGGLPNWITGAAGGFLAVGLEDVLAPSLVQTKSSLQPTVSTTQQTKLGWSPDELLLEDLVAWILGGVGT